MSSTTALPHYRVWCLTWNDDEADGSNIVGYDSLRGYKHNDRLNVYVPNVLLHDAASAAEAYASYAHNHRDGYETGWPIEFRVLCPNGAIRDFKVDREVVPEFKAVPVKPIVPVTKG